MAVVKSIRDVVRQFIQPALKADGRTGVQTLRTQLFGFQSYVPQWTGKAFANTAPSRVWSQFVASKNVAESALASSLRKEATHRIIGTSRPRFSYLLAFVPFVYAGNKDAEDNDVTECADTALRWVQQGVKNIQEEHEECESPKELSEVEFKERLGKESSCGAVYAADYKGKEVAVKTMFNYWYSSNGYDIVKGFRKEIELICPNKKETTGNSPYVDNVRCQPLPPHPNIVKGYGYFVDNMPVLADSKSSYPCALPRRMNGYGHNKTLFLVMKKYSCTLSQLLRSYADKNYDYSLPLLVQLLNSLAFLRSHNVAHRDLKTDNILVEMSNTSYPVLALTDFGCSLRDDNYDLKIPYYTNEMSKGGNPALMAPEIANTSAGPGKFLDYDKADVWAAGAIAYEIFGQENPLTGTAKNEFQPVTGNKNLFVDKLVSLMLQPNPNRRISASVAATYANLLLFSPWYNNTVEMPTEGQVRRWLELAKRLTLFQLLSLVGNPSFKSTLIEQRVTFLLKTSVAEVMQALQLMYATEACS